VPAIREFFSLLSGSSSNGMRIYRAAVLLGGLCCGILAGQPISVERFDGSKLTIDNYSEHAATAFVFLSSRSPETRAAADAIRALNDRTRRRGIMFASIFPNAAENGEEMVSFCQASGFVFPCYRDPSRAAARALGATVTPQAFLPDPAGKIVYQGNIAGLEKAVDDVIAKRPVSVASAVASGTPIDRPGAPLPIEDSHGRLTYASELIFDNIAGAPAHHASSITEAANGDLWVSWYGGSYESADDEALFLARQKKGERTWERPRMLLRNPEAPVGNAVVFKDQRGRLWIVWGRMEARQQLLAHTGWERTRLLYRISEDNGVTWSKDALFPMDTTGWLPRNLPYNSPPANSSFLSAMNATIAISPSSLLRKMRAPRGPAPRTSQRAAAGRATDGRAAAGWFPSRLFADGYTSAPEGVLRSWNDVESRQAN
jgi:hypothetical protein